MPIGFFRPLVPRTNLGIGGPTVYLLEASSLLFSTALKHLKTELRSATLDRVSAETIDGASSGAVYRQHEMLDRFGLRPFSNFDFKERSLALL